MLSTIIISGILLVMVFFAVKSLIKNLRSGKCSGCSGCRSYGKEGGCSGCEIYKKESECSSFIDESHKKD